MYKLVEYYPSNVNGVKPCLVKMGKKKITVIMCTDKGVTKSVVPMSEQKHMTDLEGSTLKAINRWLLHTRKTLGMTKGARNELRVEKLRLKGATA